MFETKAMPKALGLFEGLQMFDCLRWELSQISATRNCRSTLSGIAPRSSSSFICAPALSSVLLTFQSSVACEDFGRGKPSAEVGSVRHDPAMTEFQFALPLIMIVGADSLIT